VLPIACATPRSLSPPQAVNPFLGTWMTAERAGITFRPDTILLHSPGAPPQAFAKDPCGGFFAFRYAVASRATLTAPIPRQPGPQDTLSRLLSRPRNRVAEFACDRVDQIYALLNDRELSAIYCDGDIGGIERLTRYGS
jgi:hypothetical protein